MDEVTTTVNILGRSYSLRTAAGEEAVLAAAAQRIDSMARGFAQQFPRKDAQDLVAMTALLQVVQLMRTEQRPAATDAIERRLQTLDHSLDQYIQSIE